MDPGVEGKSRAKRSARTRGEEGEEDAPGKALGSRSKFGFGHKRVTTRQADASDASHQVTS